MTTSLALAPVAPHDDRLGVLAALHPRLWYWRHLEDERPCWCSDGGSDQRCDLGEALWRLASAPGDDRRRCLCSGCRAGRGEASA